MSLVNVKNAKSSVRDLSSGAILNTDTAGVKAAQIRKQREATLAYLATLPERIQILTNRISELEKAVLNSKR